MNLRKEMIGKVIKGIINGEKIAEQWININIAVQIAEQYAKEQKVDVDNLLRDCHLLIQAGIYSEDGIDGIGGQEILDKIEKTIKVKRSHKDITGLRET